jgi:hypothetical protein
VQWLCFSLFHRDEGEVCVKEKIELRELWEFVKRGGRSKGDLERNSCEVADVYAASLTSALPPPSSVSIPPGFNPNTRCMRVIIDRLHYEHRPLALYGVVAGLHCLYSLYLTAVCGYRYYSSAFLCYFHRPPSSPTAPLLPTLLFVHGICNGVSSYGQMVARLTASGNRHVILVVLPFISMQVCVKVPTAKETVVALKEALTWHTATSAGTAPPKSIIVGHSYGTLLASWFIKAYPHMLLSVVLVDPVCFLLFTPHLCRQQTLLYPLHRPLLHYSLTDSCVSISLFFFASVRLQFLVSASCVSHASFAVVFRGP